MTRLPDTGIAVWPVGNGDAITLRAPNGLTIQFDINHSADEDNDWAPVVDLLADELDQVEHNGNMVPELPVLFLSHHDEDHCRGIPRLFDADEFRVNELIITLRCFIEAREADELTELGDVLLEEAERRRDAEIEAAEQGERAAPGDRLQIVGYADVLETDGWTEFPDSLLTVPGNLLELLDNEDHSEHIEVFVHSPFRDEVENGDRNDSCLAVHVTMINGETRDRYLLLGDLKHETIDAIFDISETNDNTDRLEWDVLVASHHCSRHAVLTADTESDGYIESDAADAIGRYAATGAVVLVSSDGNYTGPSDTGKNPPHSDARAVYEGIVGKSNVHDAHHEAQGADSYPLVIVAATNNSLPTVAERATRLAQLASSSGPPLVKGRRYIEGTDQKFA